MKITDVTLTLFAWDDIPPTQYGQHSRFAGSSALGLLRIVTDEGVEGHAFLGSASNSATTDGQGLITHLKPVLMGRNPLHREALVVDLWKKQRAAACAPSARSTWRCGTFWARRSASRSIACSAPIARRCRPMPAPPCSPRPPPMPRRREKFKETRLGGLQDPSADALEGGHQGLRGGAQGRRRLHHHARFDLVLRLSRRRCGSAAPPRRWASTGTRIRSPTRTSTTT